MCVNLLQYTSSICNYITPVVEEADSITIKPDDYEAWYCKGISLDSLGNSVDSLDAYDKVTTIKPDHEEAWNNKSIVLCKLNRHAEALGALDQAVNINPNGL